MKFRLIAFDWSGTVSDDRLPVYEANSRQARQYGLPVLAYEDWQHSASMTVIQHFNQYNVPHSDDAIFAHFNEHYQQIYQGGLVPIVYPDAKKVLTAIKKQKIKTAIVSAHEEDQVKAEAKSFGILEHFDTISGSARNKTAALVRVCRDLGVDPSQTLYIGDTIFDIRSAKAVPMNAAGITTGYHTKESLAAEEPDYLLQSLSDLLTLLG